MLRANYRAPPDIGLEAMCVLALSGPAAEAAFYGAANDGSDDVDQHMVRGYLSRYYGPLLAAELVRMRDAADRLVRTERQRIRQIADALLQFGSLSGEQITAL